MAIYGMNYQELPNRPVMTDVFESLPLDGNDIDAFDRDVAMHAARGGLDLGDGVYNIHTCNDFSKRSIACIAG